MRLASSGLGTWSRSDSSSASAVCSSKGSACGAAAPAKQQATSALSFSKVKQLQSGVMTQSTARHTSLFLPRTNLQGAQDVRFTH